MIKSFRDKWLEKWYWEGQSTKKLSANIYDQLIRKLTILESATCDKDLRSPPGNHFEKLSGNLSPKRSIRVNQQWRLTFDWDGHDVADVYLDPHDY